jgi:lysophospholipase L1-like esterase
MIKNITLLIFSVFFTLIISEIFLRVIDYNYSPVKIELKNEVLANSDWRDYHAFEDDHFVYDPNLIWKPKKNYSVFNSQGFRGRELGYKKNGEFRIFTIGDSNTLGWQGEQDAPNWPMYLEDLIRGSNKRITVTNVGVWGYSSFQGLRRFQEILQYQPDMVIISFGSNDAHQVIFSDEEYAGQNKQTDIYKKILNFRISKLIIAFHDKLILFRKEDGKLLTPRVSLRDYKSNLNEIIKTAKENNIKTVLLTRPFIGESPDKLWWKNFGPAYNSTTMDVAKNNGIPVVDVYEYFKDKDLYFTDVCHFTRLGHKIAAALIYDKIYSSLPAPLKKITFNDYLEKLDNSFNESGTLLPKNIDSKLTNFYHDYIWTNGEGTIKYIKYVIKPQDRFLGLKTFGWNPYKEYFEKLKLQVFINGLKLQYSHKEDNTYYFNIDKTFKQITEIRIISSTFIPKALGINNDPRKLGIDVAAIEIK